MHEEYGCYFKSDSVLPTRVLDLGSVTNSNSLRLYCSKKDERGDYVALSHCWGTFVGLPGQSEDCRTLRHNIDTRLEKIDMSRLPKTFQDAIRVTRELGKRYLWIDSLCIVQDDEEDWAREAKTMETVYSMAYCTIAATSSISSAGGFLGSRPKRKYLKIKMELKGLKTPMYVCEMIDNFHQDVEESVLNKRGWVLQERALSRRIIHFSATQTYWECGMGVHCETMTWMYK